MAKKKDNVVQFDPSVTPSEYKVGDWVYYSFELHEVKKLDGDGKIKELSDGNVVLTATEGKNLNDNTLPLNPVNKTISEGFKKIAEEFSGYNAAARLNIPEVYPWLVSLWKLSATKNNKETFESVAAEIGRMRKQIVDIINQLHTNIKFEVVAAVPGKDGQPETPAVTFPLFK